MPAVAPKVAVDLEWRMRVEEIREQSGVGGVAGCPASLIGHAGEIDQVPQDACRRGRHRGSAPTG
jgi:hypothetical protein